MDKKPTGATALLDAIFKSFGGPSAIIHKHLTMFGRQQLVNWRIRGKIPLKHTTMVAEALDIPIWGLNYEDLSTLQPDKAPPWKDVVESYDLSVVQVKSILYLKPPQRGKPFEDRK